MNIILNQQKILRIIQARKKLKITPFELGEKAKVSVRTIQDLESGRRNSFSETTIMSLCRVLDLDFDYLIEGLDTVKIEDIPSGFGNGGPYPTKRTGLKYTRKRWSFLFLILSGILMILAIIVIPHSVNKDSTISNNDETDYERRDWVDPEYKDRWPIWGVYAEADSRCSQIINYIDMKKFARPGETIPVRIKWSYYYPNGNAETYVSAFTVWEPDREIRVFDGILREKGNEIRQFEINCPYYPGVYRMRIFYALAFAPVASFYGSPPPDQQTSPYGAYAEMTIEVLPQ